MKNLFNPDSFLMRFLSRVADMMLLNALWIIFCLPVFTIGASTTAMYHVTMKIASKEEYGILKTFWKAFRCNFVPATKVFLLLLIPLLFVAADTAMLIFGVLGQGVFTNILLALPALLFSMIWSYVYPLTARFDNPTMVTVKNAMLLSIANFPKTLLITALNLLPLVWAVVDPISFAQCFVYFLLGGFAWIAYGNGIILNRIFNRLIEQKAGEEDA